VTADRVAVFDQHAGNEFEARPGRSSIRPSGATG